jgi:aspergillopepsin I
MPSSTWSITYADGTTASGSVYMDEVDVGGTLVVSQTVGVALQVSPQLQEEPADGVLGLASSRLNTSMSGLMFAGSQHLITRTVIPRPQKTFLQNALDQGAIEDAVFTADLKRGTPGSYDFGFIDPTKYIEPITWVP